MNWRFWSRRERLRDRASDWLARLRGPDAERHRPAFEQWILEHPDHANAYESVQATWGLSDDIRYTPTGRARSLPDRPPAFRRLAPYAIAAAALLALAAGAFILIVQPSVTGPAAHMASDRFATAVGEIRTFTLADGSTVTLDTDSALRVLLTGTDRQLHLERGRARFDVAHDPDRPFKVDTGAGMVTARGTLFDVARFDGKVHVVLLRGAVDVQIPAAGPDPTAARVERMRPGQQLTIAPQAATPARAVASEPKWPTGMLEFDGAPLRDVLAEANRYGAMPIRLADPALGALRVTGAYRAGDTAGLARTLAASFGLSHTATADGDILLSGPGTR